MLGLGGKRTDCQWNGYEGQKTVAYTILVHDRKPLFRKAEVVDRLIEILAVRLEGHQCDAPIYCFMPDHLHVLVRGLHERANSKHAIDKFKLSAGIWLRTNQPEFRLKHDYFDHIVRCSEDWRAQAQYIALNPVRAGLIEHASDYPYTGCIGAGRSEMLEGIFFG
jgi:putative transposase